jgi:hypothetical protein
LFYINNLTNGTSYDVNVALVYKTKNLVQRELLSTDVSLSAIPQTAPPQPTGLEARVGYGTIDLLWNYDNTNTTGFYSIYLNNELAVSHVAASTNDILSENGKWKRTFTGLVAGRQYTIDVVAEKLVSGTIYVSSQQNSITAMPYDKPTQVQNVKYVPDVNTVNLSWDEPSNTSGAGLSGNGPLRYSVEIVNPANGGRNSKLFNGIEKRSYVIGSSEMIDTSNNRFTLQDRTEYTVKVRAYFDIANTQSQSTSLDYVTTVIPSRLPVKPTITAEALEKTALGKKVKLTITVDPSCNQYNTNTSLKLTRNIRDISQKLLSTKVSTQTIATAGFDPSNNVYYIDIPEGSDLFTDDALHFLNGNQLTYSCEVTSTGWTNGYNDVQSADDVTVTPSGKAIIKSMDISNNGVVLELDKNGSAFNSLTLIGVNNTQQVQVLGLSSQNAVFSNDQINSTVAKNQIAKISLPRGSWSNPLTKALAIFATENTTALRDAPAGSFIQSG